MHAAVVEALDESIGSVLETSSSAGSTIRSCFFKATTELLARCAPIILAASIGGIERNLSSVEGELVRGRHARSSDSSMVRAR